jgi:hypothetical protein
MHRCVLGRKRERERRAAVDRSLRPHTPAVSLHDPVNDGKTGVSVEGAEPRQRRLTPAGFYT